MKNLYLSTLMFVILSSSSFGQTSLPFTFKNTSPYPDNQIYVAIVGEDLTGPPGQRVWIDCKTSTQKLMTPSYNTVAGPIYNGNKGPGNNGMYAACFTKMSDIPNKTVTLPPIQGCRIFISVGQQLYFYFFGASGSPSGYTSPSHTDPTDPNKGILYEVIELTSNQYGIWANTSRVDSYNYAMGLEVYGANNTYLKTGELKTHTEIGALYKANVPAEFQNCYNSTTGSITQPTKTVEWADGTIGTMPNVGPYVNYMKPYIDQIWAKYKNEDLIFDAGDAGVWKGRVIGEQLVMTAQTGGFTGRKGIIDRRPTTQEALEGKGVLDRVIQDAPTDLMIQAQICAAITRHVIDVKTPNVGKQNWSDPSKYYLESPCNHYAKFWHMQGISFNNKSYGFAYDDVWDQSSTLHTPSPTKVTVTFGGFASITQTQSAYSNVIATIPGVIEAEKYDEGGQDIAFNDVSSTNQGGAFRTDGVDIENRDGGGYNVGYITDGEWMEYTVNVTAGTYKVEATVAATAAGKTFKIEINGTSIGTFTVPNTGGWQTWQTVSINNINLTSGKKVMRIVATSSEFNLDKITFTPTVITAIEDSQSEQIVVYPNPASSALFINGVDMNSAVLFYDVQGRIVLSSTFKGQPIDIHGLEKGVYSISIGNESHLMSKRFVKE